LRARNANVSRLVIIAVAGILDFVNTAVQVGTLLVFIGTAIAALAQIRHLRASNELDALLRITEQLRADGLQESFRYVQTGLDAKIADANYRRELGGVGFVDARVHPEINVCNWFNEVGTLVKNRLIDEDTFLDLFSRLVTYYWSRLAPVVALFRRQRGPSQYENFEYLAMLAARWHDRHPHGTYPANAKRLALVDPWLDADVER